MLPTKLTSFFLWLIFCYQTHKPINLESAIYMSVLTLNRYLLAREKLEPACLFLVSFLGCSGDCRSSEAEDVTWFCLSLSGSTEKLVSSGIPSSIVGEAFVDFCFALSWRLAWSNCVLRELISAAVIQIFCSFTPEFASSCGCTWPGNLQTC